MIDFYQKQLLINSTFDRVVLTHGTGDVCGVFSATTIFVKHPWIGKVGDNGMFQCDCFTIVPYSSQMAMILFGEQEPKSVAEPQAVFKKFQQMNPFSITINNSDDFEAATRAMNKLGIPRLANILCYQAPAYPFIWRFSGNSLDIVDAHLDGEEVALDELKNPNK